MKAEELKELRELHNISISEVCEALNIKIQTWYSWERIGVSRESRVKEIFDYFDSLPVRIPLSDHIGQERGAVAEFARKYDLDYQKVTQWVSRNWTIDEKEMAVHSSVGNISRQLFVSGKKI